MSKGNKTRSNREAKKPKKVQPKVLATADSTKGAGAAKLGMMKKK